jgi:hypothetical protein
MSLLSNRHTPRGFRFTAPELSSDTRTEDICRSSALSPGPSKACNRDAAVAIAAAHEACLGWLDANRLAPSVAPHQLAARLFRR